ncbi:MAG: hypothetical protein ACTSXU_09160, partial [Promethearchaeota archaeon]
GILFILPRRGVNARMRVSPGKFKVLAGNMLFIRARRMPRYPDFCQVKVVLTLVVSTRNRGR